MTDIIFSYIQGETNWLDDDWRKTKMKELSDIKRLSTIIDIEINFPNASTKRKAQIFGCDYCYYCTLRTKYNVKEVLK